MFLFLIFSFYLVISPFDFKDSYFVRNNFKILKETSVNLLDTYIFFSPEHLNMAKKIKKYLIFAKLYKIKGLNGVLVILGKDAYWRLKTKFGKSFFKKRKWYYVVVKKNERKMYVYSGITHRIVKIYSVAVGKNPGDKKKVGDWRTPEGRFWIVSKEDSRNWWHDFGYGPVKGAYGPYFLRIYTGKEVTKSRKTWKGIGIHGTHDPSSIGTFSTEGCIRMKNEDLLDFIKNYFSIGMPVWIDP
ncbi:hypothetical protein DRN73_06395 [Candidatus Pacearchaeota archaeon]|nr:MAG: hypothetical protein DRN73_06395 [Candidatus Pacearchaeota archaeon]